MKPIRSHSPSKTADSLSGVQTDKLSRVFNPKPCYCPQFVERPAVETITGEVSDPRELMLFHHQKS